MRPHGATRHRNVVWPGTGRLTLALLVAVPAAMACPWTSARDRWLLGIAVAALIMLLGWWRGLRFTTILRRRLALTRRRRDREALPGTGTDESGADVLTTALLHITPAGDADVLPLDLIAGYTDYYGLTAEAIRVTSRDAAPEGGALQRDTWIGLTLSGTANLAALQARSPRIPLRQTAEVAVRRLGDHLREIGWTVSAAAPDEVPGLFGPTASETWRGVCQGSADHVAAYRVDVDEALPDTLAAIWAYPAAETWTALEIVGGPAGRMLAVGCALRTGESLRGVPVPGLTAQRGNHRPALRGLHPMSTERLEGPADLSDGLLERLRWGGAAPDRARIAAPSGGRHAAATRT